MDLIRDLENKFQNINAKLISNTKVKLIDINYFGDFEKINQIFNSSKQKKYEKGLNECRDEMLKQLIQKRDQQLKEIDTFMENKQNAHYSFFIDFEIFEKEDKEEVRTLKRLKRKANCIKFNCMSFSCGLLSIFESILARSKFGNELAACKIVNYLPLMRIEENISLSSLSFNYNEYSIHLLTANRILLCFYVRTNEFTKQPKVANFQLTVQTKMVILKKNGDLVKLKDLTDRKYSSVRVNATNIIAYEYHSSLVDIYNFNLELVHSFKLDNKCAKFKLNNYEIAFFDDENSRITYYNYRTSKTKKKHYSINQNKIMDLFLDFNFIFYRILELPMVIADFDLNDNFIFIEAGFQGIRQNCISLIVLDRNKPSSHFFSIFHQYFAVSTLCGWSFYNSNFCLNYHGENGKSKLKKFDTSARCSSQDDFNTVYDEFVTDANEEFVSHGFYSTSNHKFINFQPLKINPNEKILRFKVY